jgi:hypothetical protein
MTVPEGNIAPSPAAPPSARGRWVVNAVALALLGLLVWLYVFQPPQGRIRESAKRAACKNHLRQIGIALRLYADDHDGGFPSGLAELYPTCIDNAGIFSCASAPSSWKDFEPGGTVTEKSSSFTYLPGRFAKLPSDFVLAHDKPDNHGGAGINVLRVDGTVSWVGKPELPELTKTIADQEARLPELRRKWEQERAAGKFLKGRSDSSDPGPQEMKQR